MSVIDISRNSPHYFYRKSIGTVNENLNCDIRVEKVNNGAHSVKLEMALNSLASSSQRVMLAKQRQILVLGP